MVAFNDEQLGSGFGLGFNAHFALLFSRSLSNCVQFAHNEILPSLLATSNMCFFSCVCVCVCAYTTNASTIPIASVSLCKYVTLLL